MCPSTHDGVLSCRLSPLQEGLLFHSLYAPGSGLYIIQMRMRLWQLDRRAFQAAWQAVVDRHETLRAAFHCPPDGDARQVSQPALRLEWEEHDWRDLDAQTREQRRQEYLRVDRAREFDFAVAPLMRLALMRVSDEAHDFVWTFHHILLDGWSVPLLMNEVAAHYEAFVRGVPVALPPVRPYRDYVAWLAQQDDQGAEAFWRHSLRGIDWPTRLGIERPGAPAQSDAREHQLRAIATPNTARLRAFAREHGLTQSTVAHAAWAVLLSRYGGSHRVVFGVTVAGRPTELTGADAMLGLFINTVPIAVDVEGGAPLIAWLTRQQREQGHRRRFELTPLANIQLWSRGRRHAPLFETTLTFENYPLRDAVSRAAAAGLIVTDLEVHERSSYPVVMKITPGSETRLVLEYDAERFEPQAMRDLLDHFVNLMDAIVSGQARRVGDLEMLSAGARKRLRGYSRGPADAYPDHLTLHALVEAQVDRSPDAPAIVHDAESVSYAELDRRANRLANVLTRRGVALGAIVGICLPHSIDLIVALLASLKAGAAYVPIDPAYATSRVAFMLTDSRASVLITHRALVRSAPIAPSKVIALDDEQAAVPTADHVVRPGVPVTAADVAYVMYTSGSTGRPKGVTVSHRSLVNYISFATRCYDQGQGLPAALHSSISFDLTVTSIYAPLACGGTIVVYARRDDGSFPIHAIVRDDRVGLLKLTPSHAALMKERWAPNHRLEHIVIGGEALPTALAGAVQDALHGHPTVVNEYGPTEATVGCTHHQFDAQTDSGPFVPIGRPVSNTQIHVLDHHLHLSPEGVIGEIYVGGDGVAQGYWGQPALTAERFVPDPFGTRSGARLYRTGDLATWTRMGVLDYVGRRDLQVKYHGYRIELNEVRLAMNRHPLVHDSVIVMGPEHDGTRMLVYYVADVELDPRELRAHLLQHLLRETLPNAFVRIERLPLTPNGKIDYDALPHLESPTDPVAGPVFVAPETPLQRDLCELWAAVLRRERVGLTDDYFALGGDSIGSILIASRAQQRSMPLTVRDLFEHPTVEKLARLLEQRRSAAAVGGDATPEPFNPQVSARPRFPLAALEAGELEALFARYPDIEDVYPLSPVQEGMLFHTLGAPGSGVYLPQLTLRLRGLAPELFQRAWARVSARHTILRTAVVHLGVSTPVQIVRPTAQVSWDLQDWRGVEEATQQERVDAYLHRVRVQGLALDEAPIMKLALMAVDPGGDHLFVWTCHHILLDAWSVALVLAEVMEIYTALSRGDEPSLPAPRPYREYAAWLQRQDHEQARRFWTDALAGVAAPTLMALRDDTALHGHASDRYHRQQRSLSTELSNRLRTFVKVHQLTLNTIFQGAWAIVMSQYCGTETVVFGTVVSGRPADLSGVESIPGLFINTVPTTIDVGPQETVVPWLADIQARHLQARAWGYLALSDIRACTMFPRRTPLFDTILMFENYPKLDRREAASGLRVLRIDRREHDHYPCSVVVSPDEQIALAIDYDDARFSHAGIVHVLEQLERVLSILTADSTQRLGDVPRLSPAAAQHTLVSGNAAPERFSSHASVHEAPIDAPEICEYVAPTTELERRLAQIWQDVLHVDMVGRHDNFFALGGDSILSVKIVSRLHRYGIKATVADLFAHATIAELASTIEPPAATPAASGPLTPIQHTFFAQNRRNPHHFNQAVLLAVDGLDLARVERIVSHWLSEHDAFGLRYEPAATAWTSVSPASEPHRVVGLVDLSAVHATDWRATVAHVGARLHASLHLTRGPLIRVALIRGGAHGDRLLVIVHHLAIDVVSWRLLLADLTIGPEPAALVPRAVSFQAWAHRLAAYAQTPTIAADLAYWLAHARPSTPALPLDDPHGPHSTGLAATLSMALSLEETEEVLRNARSQSITLHELLLAAVAASVSAWTKAPGVRLDVEGHGRDEPVDGVDPSGSVGWFTTIYPVALELPDAIGTDLAAAWPEALSTVVAQLRRMPKRVSSFGLLRHLHHDASVRASLAETPAAPICFNYLGHLDQGQATDSLRMAPESSGPAQDRAETRAYELEVVSKVLGGALTMEWTYSPARLSHGAVETLAMRCRALLLAIRRPARLTPSDFPLATLDGPELNGLVARYPDIEDIYPVAAVQHGLMFHSLYAPGSGVYVVQLQARLRELDVEAFQRAWALAVERHMILRTAFVHDHMRSPVQVVRRAVRPRWDVEDWRDADPATQRERLDASLAHVRRAGLAFDDAPLMRLALMRVDAADHYFLWSYHHILLDGWSARLLLREVIANYTAYRDGREPPVSAAPQYRDYIAWLRRCDPEEAARFWRETLAGAPRTVLGSRHARHDTPAATGGSGREAVALSGELTRRLRQMARRQHMTPNTLLQGAWGLVLGHYTGADEVTFGITVSGRPADLPGVESLIGNLINTVPLRVSLPGGATILSYLDAIFARNAAMRRYDHVAILPHRETSSESLFDSILSFQNVPETLDRKALHEMQGRQYVNFGRDHYPLSLGLTPRRTRLIAEICYDTSRFTQTWVERTLALLGVACDTIVSAPESMVGDALRVLARHARQLSSTPAAPDSHESSLRRARRQTVSAPTREVRHE